MWNGCRRKTLSLVVGLAALAMSAFGGAVASADQIAYSCESDLCLINPDNPSEHRYLTETDGATSTERAPAWSPDGTVIAYNGLYSAFGSWDVWTLDPSKTADEMVATNISESPDRSVESSLVPPAWSPDGSMLAYAERSHSNAEPYYESEVYVSPSDGTADPLAIDPTVKKSELTPTWSPDGATLVFSREGFLWKGPPNNSVKPTVLTNSYGYQPAFSPDGTRVAMLTFSSPAHIRVTKADGSGFKELPVDADSGSKVDWSPDSTQVVYVADELPLDRVRVAPADGSAAGHPIDMPPGWIVPHNATFSPDGTRIAFDARPSSGDTHVQILVAPADGSSPAVPITKSAVNNWEPAWKPCEGCAPPVKPQTPQTPGTGNTPGTKTPTKVRLVYFKKVYAWRDMLAVGVDCNAQGGHPDPKYCNGDGIAKALLPRTEYRPWAKPKGPKSIVFAKGSVKVPEGKSKPLKMKVTAAGRKLLSSGKTVKVTLTVKVSRPTGKAQTFKKTIKVQAEPGKVK